MRGLIWGSSENVASQLRKFLPRTARIIVLTVDDPAVWEAVTRDPSLQGPVSAVEVARVFGNRVFPGKKDLAVFAFVKSKTFETVYHFRTRNEMNRITHEALLRSVMET